MKKNYIFSVVVVVTVVTLILLFKVGKNKPGREQSKATGGNNEFVRDKAGVTPLRTGEGGELPSQSLSTSVLAVIDTDTDYETRLGAMSNLGYEISTNDVATLKNFLVAEIAQAGAFVQQAHGLVWILILCCLRGTVMIFFF